MGTLTVWKQKGLNNFKVAENPPIVGSMVSVKVPSGLLRSIREPRNKLPVTGTTKPSALVTENVCCAKAGPITDQEGGFATSPEQLPACNLTFKTESVDGSLFARTVTVPVYESPIARALVLPIDTVSAFVPETLAFNQSMPLEVLTKGMLMEPSDTFEEETVTVAGPAVNPGLPIVKETGSCENVK